MMMYNHAKAEAKFCKEWNKDQRAFKDAGMSEEQITEIYRFLNGMFQIFGETQLQSDAISVVILSVIYIAASLAANMLSIKKCDVV